MKTITVCVVVFCLVIGSLSGAKSDLYTNVYQVPPTFLNPFAGQWKPVDPFVDLAKLEPRKTAKEILMDAGISFSEGCSAIYNPSTSQLIVRNTQDQMELVEAYIESTASKVEKQIYVTFKEIQFDQQDVKNQALETFDWLLKPTEDFTIQTVGKIRTLNSYHSFLQELSRPPQEASKSPSIARGIAGVFTAPQIQLVFRAIKKELPKVEISTPPSVMTRSGQPSLVQVDGRRYGVIAVVGADEFTIDLSVFLPEHGKALFEPGDDLTTPYKLTIWDGQTVALSETRKDGTGRTVFVTARIKDPAGMDVHRSGGQVAAEKATIDELQPSESIEEIAGWSDENSELVKRADALALQANQSIADGDFTEAAKLFDQAIELLPSHEMTDARREAYQKQFKRAQVGLEDSDWFKTLPTGSSYAVGNGETLHEISIRFGTSIAKITKLNRLRSDTLEVGQLLLVQPGPGSVALPSDPAEALQSVIIRSVDLDDATLAEALGLIHRVLLAEVNAERLPSPGPKIILEDADKIKGIKITLRLSNVPTSEALRYITALAQCKYRVDGMTITVSPLGR